MEMNRHFQVKRCTRQHLEGSRKQRCSSVPAVWGPARGCSMQPPKPPILGFPGGSVPWAQPIQSSPTGDQSHFLRVPPPGNQRLEWKLQPSLPGWFPGCPPCPGAPQKSPLNPNPAVGRETALTHRRPCTFPPLSWFRELRARSKRTTEDAPGAPEVGRARVRGP